MIFMPLSLPSPPLILWQLFTHVISSIVHIAHEYDDEKEPWPNELARASAGWSRLEWAQRFEPADLKPTAEVMS